MVAEEQRTLEIVATVKDLATRAFRRMRSVIGGVTKGIVGSFRGVLRAMTSLRAAVVAVVAVVVAGKLARAFQEIAANVDEIAKSARRLNLSVETLSELKVAAEFSGVGFEKLRAALKLFQKQLVDASKGVETSQDIFRTFGVEILDESTGKLRDTGEVLEDVADAYVVFGKSQERAVLGQRLFGEESSDLTSILESGAVGLRNMRKEARELGATITGSGAAGLEGFNDALLRVETSIGAVSRNLVTAIAGKATPILNDLARTISQNRDEIVRFLQQIAVGILSVVRDVGAAILRFADLTGDILGSRRSGIRKAIKAMGGDLKLVERGLRRAESRLRLFDKKVAAGTPIRESLFSKEARNAASEWGKIVNLSTGAVARLVAKGVPLREAMVQNIAALRDEIASRKGLIQGKTEELNANENLIGSLDRLIERYRNAGRVSSGFLDEVKRLREAAAGGSGSIFDNLGPQNVFQGAKGQTSRAEAEAAEKAAADARAKQALIRDKQDAERRRKAIEAEAAIKRQVAAIENETAILRSTGRERELRELEANTAARISQIRASGDEEAEVVAANLELIAALREDAARRRIELEGSTNQGVLAGLRQFREEAEDSFGQGRKAALDFANSVETNLSTAISSIILRTKSAKQAFKDFARGVVESIANIIAELLALKAIALVLSLIPGGSGFTTIFGSLGGAQKSRFRGGDFGGPKRSPSVPIAGAGSGPLGGRGQTIIMQNTFEIKANDQRGIRELLVENFQTIEDNLLRVVSTKPKVRRAFAALR